MLIAGFARLWLAARLDRLGKQLEAVSALVRQEMAELVGNEERANELLEEWRQDRDAGKKATRQVWITWGVIGAGALAWWWFSTGRYVWVITTTLESRATGHARAAGGHVCLVGVPPKWGMRRVPKGPKLRVLDWVVMTAEGQT